MSSGIKMIFQLSVMFLQTLVYYAEAKSVSPSNMQSAHLPRQNIYQGDIVIPTGVVDEFFFRGTKDKMVGKRRVRRGARRRREFLWRTRVIPYEISYQLRRYKSVIMSAIQEFEKKTCLKFVHRTNEPNWILFESGKGCSSSVGKVYWKRGSQEITLDYMCMYKGTIVHEIMHALGFWHEHSRPDRDNYIEILWENMDTNNEVNFEKFGHWEVDTLALGFDLESVMLYGNKAFSKNNKPTMRSIKNANKILGNWNGLSALDVIKINTLYDCKKANPKKEKLSWKKFSFSAWSSWSPCDPKCYKYRQRFCKANNKKKCYGADKHGIQTEVTVCLPHECYAPVDGHWSRWSSWSKCSAQCGQGTRSRIRPCNDPAPKYGGKFCTGKSVDIEACHEYQCSEDPDGCTFDEGECHWRKDPTNIYYSWSRLSGPTPSALTGPVEDHTSGTGSYMYAESSFPANYGLTAQYVSKIMDSISGRCMTFSYHMFGLDMGSLRILTREVNSGREHLVWEKTGNQGPGWKTQNVSLVNMEKFQVIFEAVHPGSYLSDIAIDDIFFADGMCQTGMEQCPKEGLPLGLQKNVIPDLAIHASSQKQVQYSPKYARLNNDNGWCASERFMYIPQFIKVDLGKIRQVTAIATQGHPYLKSWVTSFKVYYSINGKSWRLVTEQRHLKVFSGNIDNNTPMRNDLPLPVKARYIGVGPTRWVGSQMCMRLELFGCPTTMEEGLQNDVED